MAIQSYKKAIELNPNNEEYYFNIGNFYLEKLKFNEAVESYKQSLKIKKLIYFIL